LWQIWRSNFVSPCRYSSFGSIDGCPARWWHSRLSVWTENISWKKRYILICCMFLYLHSYIQKYLAEMRVVTYGKEVLERNHATLLFLNNGSNFL
jgi:hypothetical protein